MANTTIDNTCSVFQVPGVAIVADHVVMLPCCEKKVIHILYVLCLDGDFTSCRQKYIEKST